MNEVTVLLSFVNLVNNMSLPPSDLKVCEVSGNGGFTELTIFKVDRKPEEICTTLLGLQENDLFRELRLDYQPPDGMMSDECKLSDECMLFVSTSECDAGPGEGTSDVITIILTRMWKKHFTNTTCQ